MLLKSRQVIELTFREIAQPTFVCLVVSGATAPQWAKASSFTRFLDPTQRRITVDRTPLGE